MLFFIKNNLKNLLTLSFWNDRMIMKEVNDIKTLTIRLDDELHKRFKIYAVDKGKDMQAILIEHIKKLLESEIKAK